jgi:hypothetical protein
VENFWVLRFEPGTFPGGHDGNSEALFVSHEQDCNWSSVAEEQSQVAVLKSQRSQSSSSNREHQLQVGIRHPSPTVF